MLNYNEKYYGKRIIISNSCTNNNVKYTYKCIDFLKKMDVLIYVFGVLIIVNVAMIIERLIWGGGFV